MNAIDAPEHELHKADNVDLKDVWEDVPAPPNPVLKPFQKDTTYGRARGNTWGYQSDRSRTRKHLDKFFYTGQVETMALTEPQDVTGKLGRVGIDLKTDVEAWEGETADVVIKRGEMVMKPRKAYFNREQAERMFKEVDRHGQSRGQKLRLTTTNTWASDHFGISVGLRII
jgi:hypothetical protein